MQNTNEKIKNEIGWVILLGLLGCYAAMCLQGCSLGAEYGDRVTLSGTPKGIQAFSDMTNGLIRTGKESPEQPSEFFAHRRTQENQETARKGQAVGFWQRLTN